MDLKQDISDFCKGGQYNSGHKDGKQYCLVEDDRCPYYKQVKQNSICTQYNITYGRNIQSSYKTRK